MSELWYKEAVIYCLDVETFQDSDGDGVGDFRGLESRLDHMRALGVTCLWLLPFYPTPNRDNGYDVVDYYGVDERLGTLGDFVDFMRAARELGMRVIVDLVANHTSDEHPWFRAARSDPDSPYRDWYVWSEEEPEDISEGVVFPGFQDSIWTYDEEAGAWYLHRFYEHQPDLNVSNPAVREEIKRIMGFWLQLGVSGFRLDAAPFFIEHLGLDDVGAAEPHEYLQELRSFLSWRQGDAVLLAEANVEPDHVHEYFGEELRLHMLFNFLVNQHLFLALARQEKAPLIEGLRLAPEAKGEDQWVNFLRNHDELDLGRLTDKQRQEVFEAFAPDEDMRLYDRGIRRRLAPMLAGDAARLRLANSLLLTLPGTPVLRYGQEIGMGEDLSLPERDPVRTPMQWSDADNGGFSTAEPEDLVRPVIADGPFGYGRVNVEAQRRDPDSLLRWMEEAVRVRRDEAAAWHGPWRLHDTDDPAVLAHSCGADGCAVVALHNLAPHEAEVDLDLGGLDAARLIPVFGAGERLEVEDGRASVTIAGYGYHWYRAERDGQA